MNSLESIEDEYLTKENNIYLTRHEKLAEEFLKKYKEYHITDLKEAGLPKEYIEAFIENFFYRKIRNIVSATIKCLKKETDTDAAANFLVGLTSLKDAELLKELVGIATEFDDEKSRGKIYQKFGNAFHLRGVDWWDEAEKYYEEAKRIYRKLKEQDPAYLPNYAMTLNNLGVLYRNRGEFDKAEKCYEEAKRIYEKLPEDTLSAYRSAYAETLQNLGKLYLNTNPARAKECLGRALEIYEEFASKSKLYAEKAKEVKEMLKK